MSDLLRDSNMQKDFDINDHVLNYREFLIQSCPLFVKSGGDVGSDCWEDFLESNFTFLVVNRIGEKTGHWIDSQYGVKYTKKPACHIVVKVTVGTPIQVGEEVEDHTLTFKEAIASEGLEFTFTEFSYPFADEEDFAANHGYAFGYTDGGAICAPIDYCSFYVRA